MSHTSTSSLNSTPIATSKVNLVLHQAKLSPFDQNYTLTGILKDIQNSINRLVSSKKGERNAVEIDEKAELCILEKVQEEVVILKTIIINNINQIFSSIYPTKTCPKSEDPTNHTDSQKRKSEDENLNKSLTISDFDLEGNNKINSLEINRESLAHHQRIYAEQEDGNYLRRDSNCHDKIRIQDEDEDEDEECGGNLNDLICYQDEKTIVINKRRYMESLRNSKVNQFSPISERPVQEQYSVQKCSQQQRKENISKVVDRKLFFNPYRDHLYVRILSKHAEQHYKSLFGQNSQTKRSSYRKFNYLQQFKRS